MNDITVDFVAATPSPCHDQPKPRVFPRFCVMIAIVVFCGAVCLAIGVIVFNKRKQPDVKNIMSNIQQSPGLKVNIKALRSSMQWKGKSEVSMYIVPRPAGSPSATLDFDAILIQQDDQVLETYVLLDNRAYWSISSGETLLRSGCLDESPSSPPVNLVQASLESSRAVKNVLVTDDSSMPMECGSGQLLKLSFAGETFVFCNSNTNHLSFGRSSDLEISIEYLTDPNQVPDIVAPPDLDCPLVRTAPPTLGTRILLESNNLVGTAVSASLDAATCGCKGPQKPCLFIHGVGLNATASLTDTFTDYWGAIHDHAPCCTTTKFAHMDTVTRGWDDESLQREFCDMALQVASGNNGSTISDLILTTHSMGNMIASAALVNNFCEFSSGVTWVSLAAPIQGSKSANYLVQKCNSGSWSDWIIKGLLKMAGLCPVNAGYSSLLHQSTVNANRVHNLEAIQSKRAQHVSKLACGTSAIGLLSVYSGLQVVAMLSKHASANDGVVDVTSCQAGYGSSNFGTTYTSSNYEVALNHFDLPFRHGDG
ncbi:hypothetical protein AC1031_004468 [Aphanomyces cochlioides]|nr:hypothetical protein AC1031_004468 [Aphanomyces cochlioides]